MGRLDLEVLMRPVSDVSPCGDNLEYDADFGALERAAEGTPEHVIGAAVTKAEPPDWPAVARMAGELFGRTKDLRVAMRLARALLITEGLAGFDEGLGLIARLLAEHWQDVHPQLDPEDGNDPTLRVNVLSELCSRETIIADVRAAPLARSPALGAVNYRHVALASGELKPVDGPAPKDMTEIRAVFLDCDADELLATDAAARACVRHLVAIEDVLTRNVSVTRTIDFAPALSLMRSIAKFVDERVANVGWSWPRVPRRKTFRQKRRVRRPGTARRQRPGQFPRRSTAETMSFACSTASARTMKNTSRRAPCRCCW